MKTIRTPRRRLHGEGGVSAVIVVVSLTALFGSALLSVDAGSVWTTRRALVSHTDAAALAAARYLDARGATACSEARSSGTASAAAAEARTLLGSDDSAATLEGFVVEPHGGDCSAGSGRVRVEARETAALTFAGMFGIDEVRPFASSTAQYGPIASAGGLRPISICDKEPHFVEWMNADGDPALLGGGPGHTRVGGAVVHRIYFHRGPSGCGTATGNWDWLDYNDNATPNGVTAIRQWLPDGYPGFVSLGDSGAGIGADCNPEYDGRQDACTPKGGAGGGSAESELQSLRDRGIVFPILVYDKVVNRTDPAGCATPPPWEGNGVNARFCPAAFLLVRLHGWDKVTGQLTDDSYLDLEFVDDWWTGQIGIDPAAGRTTVHGVQLCGTDYGGTTDIHCDV